MFLLNLAVPAADLSVGQPLLDIQYPLDGNPEYREEEGAADCIAAKPVRFDTALKKSIPVYESVRRITCQKRHLYERDGHISVRRTVNKIDHRGEAG